MAAISSPKTPTVTPAVAKQGAKTSNVIALFAVITVVIVLIAGIISKNLIGDFQHDQKVAAKKSTASATLSKDASIANDLVTQYNNLGAKGVVLSNALPTSADFPGLANAVEAMAFSTGVVYKDVTEANETSPSVTSTTAPSAAAPTVQTEGLTITVGGSYANLLRFFQAIETSVRPIKVNSIGVTGSSSSNLSATIDATSYYQAPTSFTIGTETVK